MPPKGPISQAEAVEAATKIQALARRVHSREIGYGMVAERYERIYDPRNDVYYYYNVFDDTSM